MDQWNQIEQSFALSQLFCQHCFLLSECSPESRETLLVLVLDILNSHSKLCVSVTRHGNNNNLKEVGHQKAAMSRAIGQTPNIQQRTLLKKFNV